MCGRYAITLPAEAMATLFAADGRPNLAPRWNVAPTQDAPVIAVVDGARSLTMMRWAFRPAWMTAPPRGRPVINARVETAAAGNMFRAAFARRRALVPADGFYEWRAGDGGKTPFFIHALDDAPLAFAALWTGRETEDGPERSFAVLTQAANAQAAPYHHRMPVILPPGAWAAWLDADQGADEAATLLGDASPPDLAFREVSELVNAVRNDGPELIAPAAQTRLL